MEKGTFNFKLIFSGLSVIALVLFLLWIIFSPKKIKVDIASVVIGPFKESIRAPGLLRAKEKYTLNAFSDGDLKRMELKVGDFVKKGQILTTLLWDLEKRSVVSPVNGVISKIFRESDGPVRRGEPIVEIIDPSTLEIVAEVLTTDAIRLKAGGEVILENLYVEENLRAKITKISKVGFTKVSALGVEEERTEVIAEFVSESKAVLEAFGSTFHVDLEFLLNETNDALIVPIGAIYRDGAKWAVYVVENGQARKRPIEIEAMGANEVSIRSGLNKGETVILYPGDLVQDGAYVNW